MTQIRPLRTNVRRKAKDLSAVNWAVGENAKWFESDYEFRRYTDFQVKPTDERVNFEFAIQLAARRPLRFCVAPVAPTLRILSKVSTELFALFI